MSKNPRMLPKRKKWRAALALVLAPLPVSIAYALMLWGITGAASRQVPPTNELAAVLLGAFILLLGVSLIFTWPFHAIAFRRRWRRAVTYIVAGGIFGALLAGALAAWYMITTARAFGLGIAYLFGVAIGITFTSILPIASLFWMFWLIRRPDKDRDGDPLHVFD